MDLRRIKDTIERRSGALMSLFAWTKTVTDRDDWGAVTLDGQADAVWGDGHMQEQALEGAVHLFCRNVDSTAPAGVQAGLQELGVSWRLDDVRYEETTRLLHWVWIWREWGEP